MENRYATIQWVEEFDYIFPVRVEHIADEWCRVTFNGETHYMKVRHPGVRLIIYELIDRLYP
jgi:hypothetical protein